MKAEPCIVSVLTMWSSSSSWISSTAERMNVPVSRYEIMLNIICKWYTVCIDLRHGHEVWRIICFVVLKVPESSNTESLFFLWDSDSDCDINQKPKKNPESFIRSFIHAFLECCNQLFPQYTASELWWLSEGKTGDYQNCSVLYCVLKLCTVISTFRWAVLTVLWIGFCHTGPISLVHRFIYVLCFVFFFHTA